MKTRLIRIGNSRGVHIPKPLIEQSGLSEDIELILKDNEIVLRSANGPRKGWDQAFRKMTEQGDDLYPKILSHTGNNDISRQTGPDCTRSNSNR